jgi:hypothetical protein
MLLSIQETLSDVQSGCRLYFSAPKTLCNKNTATHMRVAAFVLLATYFTIIIPAIVGAVYGAAYGINCLIGRISAKSAVSPSTPAATLKPTELSKFEQLQSILEKHGVRHTDVTDDMLQVKAGADTLRLAYAALESPNNLSSKQFLGSDAFATFKGVVGTKGLPLNSDLATFFSGIN